MFSPDGTLISASAAPHCGAGLKSASWLTYINFDWATLPPVLSGLNHMGDGRSAARQSGPRGFLLGWLHALIVLQWPRGTQEEEVDRERVYYKFSPVHGNDTFYFFWNKAKFYQ